MTHENEDRPAGGVDWHRRLGPRRVYELLRLEAFLGIPEDAWTGAYPPPTGDDRGLHAALLAWSLGEIPKRDVPAAEALLQEDERARRYIARVKEVLERVRRP